MSATSRVPRLGSETLTKVFEGMVVRDRTGERIGTVAFVYLGASSEAAIASGRGAARAPDRASRDRSPRAKIARAFRPPDSLPEIVRARLMRHGCIRIDMHGLLRGDRYALPDQIARVTRSGVTLNVTRGQLIRR